MAAGDRAIFPLYHLTLGHRRLAIASRRFRREPQGRASG